MSRCSEALLLLGKYTHALRLSSPGEVICEFVGTHKRTCTDSVTADGSRGTERAILFCSAANGGPDVHLPLGGVQRFGPQIIGAAGAGVQRILYLCQVLLFLTTQGVVTEGVRISASFDKRT